MNTIQKVYFTASKLLFFIILCTITSCSKSDNSSAQPSTVAFQVPATEDIVMYEINPNAFSSSKNLQGITNRLSEIKALGVNTIWIMPIYPVGSLKSFGSPYCVKDYTSVNPNFGTLADLKNLVNKAHEKNIAVLLDWVANHTSWDNAWISNPGWYSQDNTGQIISPAGTGWNDVADLNYNNTAMRQAMIDAMKYWVINADVDGFRCDAADFVPYDFWQQANASLNAIPGKKLIMLAEGSRSDHFTAGFQMNFSWDYLTTLKSVFSASGNASTLFTTNTSEYTVVPSGKRKLRFTTNHDESNIAVPTTVFKSKSGALAASVISIYLQGVPLLYCGQEVGVSSTAVYNGSNTIDWNANPDMLSEYKKLLTFYNASATARKGILQTYNDTNISVFQKSLGTENLLVLVNTRSGSQSFTVPSSIQGIWTDALTNNPLTLSNTIALNGYGYLVLKK